MTATLTASMTMREFFEEVLKLPYRPNSQSNPKHENQVADTLRKHGFAIISKKEFKQNYSSDYSLLPDMTAVREPNGSQQPPDFVFKINGKCYELECKSGGQRVAKPMYNATNPIEEAFYIFTSKKYNETTVYRGVDVFPPELAKIFDDHRNKVQKLYDETNKLAAKHPMNIRGFKAQYRWMIDQGGGAAKIDYFAHFDRSRCESKVLNYNFG